MNLLPKGKISRLPEPLREQINHRMDHGDTGKNIADWLNSLPEVQSLLAAEFGGKPIREQNLSEWRKRGFQLWCFQRQLADIVSGLRQRPRPLIHESHNP